MMLGKCKPEFKGGDGNDGMKFKIIRIILKI